MVLNRFLATCTAMIGCGLVAGSAVTFGAAARDASPSTLAVTELVLHAAGYLPPSHLELADTLANPRSVRPSERVVSSVGSEDFTAWADAFQRRFDRHPQFNSLEINESRTAATLWWHGARTPELEVAVKQSLSVEIAVAASRFSPADLQAAANRLLSERTLSIVAATIRPDGSGIDVSTRRAPVSEVLRKEIAMIAALPVAVKNEDVVAYRNY